MADPAGKLCIIDGRLCFATHRNRGVPVVDDVGYAEWMLRSDFPRSTKALIRKELEPVSVPADEPRWDDMDDERTLWSPE